MRAFECVDGKLNAINIKTPYNEATVYCRSTCLEQYARDS